MKKSLLAVAAIVSMSLTEAADQPQADRPAPYKAVTGRYAIYSGDLDEQRAPTASDRKLSLIINGQPAKDIFDSMGSDDKTTCGSEGARSRTKGSTWCSYRPKRGYQCYLGLDLKTGKSIAGGIC